MTSLKLIAIAITLIAGLGAATESALAGSDPIYHWAYPDAYKSNAQAVRQPFSAESGFPALYR